MLIIEIFFALLSFVFNKLNKFVIGNLYTFYLTFNKKKANQWRVIDNKLIDSWLNLAVLMTKAPRWNTHAIIGTLGPFSVENNLSLDIISANNSAQSWIAIFYSFPGYKTITTIESSQVDNSTEWHSISLAKGKYTIGLRYYQYGNNLTLPSIKIDNILVTNKTNIDANSNDFYKSLINKKNSYFLALHYYIYVIFKLQKFLPSSFVKNEFLPVGATDTKFFYDYLDQGDILEIEVDENSLRLYDIYINLYDICSLPLDYCKLDQSTIKMSFFSQRGYYLIRVKEKEPLNNEFSDLKLYLTKSQ
ncbi:MAG: hypothetical protein IGQ45_14525 [Cyanobacterium sp. T60_A2020_053]|nr:hypothetical protein [Cyanobacterium sp. T60_A2020_053]